MTATSAKRGERSPRRPGNRAGLDSDQVLAVARDVVRGEGVEGLTMRRLAERLGVAPNALYSHYADKGALLDAVLDSLLGEVASSHRNQVDWRDALVALMVASRRMLLDHQEFLPHLMARPMRGPNAARLGEETLALLEHGGINGPVAVDALRALLTFTFGSVVLDAPRAREPDPARRERESEVAFRARSELERVSRLSEPLARRPVEGAFEAGLRWLIDGIQRGVAAA